MKLTVAFGARSLSASRSAQRYLHLYFSSPHRLMKSFLHRNRRAYLFGVPIIAFVHFHLFLNAFGIGFGLGVAGESISFGS